ncbi:hypothetical protein EON63_20060 [archaeon]|nr:MAG: hypothetical protein EON63_20060 [archaeon]
MTIHASSSAPGKAILFGEHAVVYGVTAIAVALSDLRIKADVVSYPRSPSLAHILSRYFYIDA